MEIKLKNCIVCKSKFKPFNSLQRVCSNKCAVLFAKEKQALKQAKNDSLLIAAKEEKRNSKPKLEARLQTVINSIVRILDKGHACISSGRPLGKKYDAGHLFTVKAHPTLRFHLFNIFGQSVHDNQYKSGNEIEYFLRVKEVFGQDIQDYISELKQIPALHLSKEELKEAIIKAKQMEKWLKSENRLFTKDERIGLRRKINKIIGIYLN